MTRSLWAALLAGIFTGASIGVAVLIVRWV